MLLIIEPAGQRRERSEDEGRALYDRMLQFSADLKTRGVLTASQSLRTDAEGVRVQKRNGKPTLVDGPFSENQGNGRRLLPARLRDQGRGHSDRRRVPGCRMGHGRGARVRTVLHMRRHLPT
jgi:hypothetical protein